MKQFIVAVLLAGTLSLCLLEFVFSPEPKSVVLKSSYDCVDGLLDRYNRGHFTAARHSVSPVTMTEDSETIRLRNQILELAYENTILRKSNDLENHHVTQLLDIERELVQIKSAIDKQNQTPHAAIDQLMYWIRNELSEHQAQTEMEIMGIRQDMELRDEERSNN